MATTSNVRVVIRIRPPNADDGVPCVAKIADDKVELARPPDSLRYTFDGVYDENATQSEIFSREVEPALQSLLQGVNTTIFCYGITGSGKTHTMQGTDNNPGMTPRSVSQVLKMIQKSPEHSLKMAYFEIYNDKIFDLLSKTTRDTPLLMREDQNKKIIIQNLSETVITTVDDFMKVYGFAVRNRKVSATALNNQSSRSHGILRLRLISAKANQKVISSKLHLIDLAGSEDNRKTNNAGARMTESSAINTSLFVLAQVVEGLKKGSSRIPFRQSSLTRLLQDSLGGNAHCLMIANIAPGKVHAPNTIRTLEFASSSRQVVNTPTVAVEADPAASQRRPWDARPGTQKAPSSSDRRVNPTLEPSYDIEKLTDQLWLKLQQRMENRDKEIRKQARSVGPKEKQDFETKIEQVQKIRSSTSEKPNKPFDPDLLTPRTKVNIAKQEIAKAKKGSSLQEQIQHYRQAQKFYPRSDKLAAKIAGLEQQLKQEEEAEFQKDMKELIPNLVGLQLKKDFLETPYTAPLPKDNLARKGSSEKKTDTKFAGKIGFDRSLFDSSSEDSSSDSSSDSSDEFNSSFSSYSSEDEAPKSKPKPKTPTLASIQTQTTLSLKESDKENNPNTKVKKTLSAAPKPKQDKSGKVNDQQMIARFNVVLAEIDVEDKDKKYATLLKTINDGSVLDLLKIKTLGPKRAEELVKFRSENGPVSHIYELVQIGGFGEKGVQSLLQKNLT